MVQAEAGTRFHRDLLWTFQCCAPHERPVDSRRPICLEPWSHEVQTHVREDALARSNIGRGAEVDHRLLLLFDDQSLVAVGAHERSRLGRTIEFLAVQSSMRGANLSDGRRCADVALQMLLDDALQRDGGPLEVAGKVDLRNLRSLGFLRRRGFMVSEAVLGGCHPVLLQLPSPNLS